MLLVGCRGTTIIRDVTHPLIPGRLGGCQSAELSEIARTEDGLALSSWFRLGLTLHHKTLRDSRRIAPSALRTKKAVIRGLSGGKCSKAEFLNSNLQCVTASPTFLSRMVLISTMSL